MPPLRMDVWEGLSQSEQSHLKQMQLASNRYNYHLRKLKEGYERQGNKQ